MIANFIHYKMNSSLDIFKKRFSVFKAFKSEGILKSESSEQIKKKDLKRNNSDLNEKKNVKEIDIFKDRYHYIRGSVQKDEDGQVKLVSPYGNYCGSIINIKFKRHSRKEPVSQEKRRWK